MQHKIIEYIKKEFYILGYLNDKAILECIGDNIVTFNLYIETGSFYEIGIITKYPEFWNGMTVAEILNSKDIQFLSCRLYDKNNKETELFTQVGEVYVKSDYEH
jgi:hypothetical protein